MQRDSNAASHAEEKKDDLYRVVSQRWAWLGYLFRGRRTVGDVDIQGFSVNFSGTRWLCVVRGLRVTDFTHVVVFGSGEGLYDAFRNATTSLVKAEWKKDKFRSAV